MRGDERAGRFALCMAPALAAIVALFAGTHDVVAREAGGDVRVAPEVRGVPPLWAPEPGTTFSALWAFADPCVAGLLGDVTDDGVTNIVDAQQIARAGAGFGVSPTVTGRLPTHGDATADGLSNIIDAQQIARWGAAFSVAFPIGQPMCTITVSTTSTGTSLDPDGFTVRLDGVEAASLPASGSVDLTSLDVGAYTVALEGVATNCTVTNGPLSRGVSIVDGGTAAVSYELSCTGGSTFGRLRIQNVTDGPLPADDYTVSLDGGPPQDMPPGVDPVPGTVDFLNVESGDHTVTIGNVPPNCSVAGDPLIDFTIDPGTDVYTRHLIITCT